MPIWPQISIIIAVVISGVILGLALVVFWKILTDKIDLSMLLAESNGKASISRLQLLLFTFVIAGLYLLLSIEAGTFVEVPESVLGLLGISGGSYIVSKGIQKSGDTKSPPTSNRSDKTDQGAST